MSCEEAALPFQAHANYGTWAMRVGHLIRKHKKYVFYKCNLYKRNKKKISPGLW